MLPTLMALGLVLMAHADDDLGPVLDRDRLVRVVLAENPSIAAASASLDRARATGERARAWEDPRVSYELAPLTLGDELGQTVEVSEAIPIPGSLGRAKDRAAADVDAADADLQVTSRQLAFETCAAFDRLVLFARELEVLVHHQAILGELEQSARAAYTAGRVGFEDPTLAQLAQAHAAHEALVLEGRRAAVEAQLNGLLHRAPESDLPEPPTSLGQPDATATEGTSATVHAADERIDLARVDIDLAKQSRFPMLELMTGWSSMWDMPDDRWTIGLAATVPLRGRSAEIDEARAELARAMHERDAAADAAAVEAASARAALAQAVHVVQHYDERLLPIARDRTAALRASFVAGRSDLAAVIDALTMEKDLELERAEALSEAWTERAALTLATGGTPGLEEAP
jgi:cobalt-zinc-cadmium efflux system outer membrane protein